LPAQRTIRCLRMAAVCDAGPGEMRVGRERERGREPPRGTHGSATTTPGIRRAIQASEEKNTVLAKRYNVDRKTIGKWKARDTPFDERMGPKNSRSRDLTLEDEAIILAYRWRTRLSLDDSLVRLRHRMPKLSRSALYQCLKRRGLSKIGSTAKCPPLPSGSLARPYCFEITANEVSIPDGMFSVVFPVFLAVEELTKHPYAEVAGATPENAAAFLDHLVAECPQKIIAVATDVSPIFADLRATLNEDMAAVGPHPFAVACRANRIVHARTILPFEKPSELKRRSRAVEIRHAGRSASTPTR
jgi:hypothetical protein